MTQFAQPNAREIRQAYRLSEVKLAALLGIGVQTLQSWERERQHPQGPSRVLPQVAAKDPRAVLDAVR